MPNMKGGKNYKKTKHGSEAAVFIEAADDQQYARVIKILGNRNVLAYCNDNIVRLCHIRGAIRKDMWISAGDIVVMSCRDLEHDKSDKYEKGDIILKYDRDFYSKLKKIEGVNQKLFLPLETAETDLLKRIKESKTNYNNNTNDVEFNLHQPEDFVFEASDDDDVDVDAI